MQQKSLSRILGQFVYDTGFGAMPEPVRHEAKRSLLNFFAVALAGQNDPTLDIAAGVLEDVGTGKPQATVIGSSSRRDILSAAMLNAMSANVFDFDDTHLPTIIHPAAPIAPAVLAVAERDNLDGKALLTAFVLGVEVACRIGNSIPPAHYSNGWHITATCGVLGAAAGAGKLLCLDPTQLHWAIGIGAGHASGTVQALGSRAKSASIGSSSRNGLMSALLAKAGFDGPENSLEGAHGYLPLVGPTFDDAKITTGLGAHWEILSNTYKPYPCGVVLNAVIDCGLELHADPMVQARTAAGARIEVRGNSLMLKRGDRPEPASGREAQLSAQHAVAVALLYGKAGLPEFDDIVLKDADIRRLWGQVTMVQDDSFPDGAAEVELRWPDGKTITSTTLAPRGDLSNPMTDAELENKLRTLSRSRISEAATEALIQAVWQMEELEDINELLKHCAA